jgi:hypothetical protein
MPTNGAIMRLLEREPDRTRGTVAMAVGAGVALAAGVLAWQWYRGGRRGLERQLEEELARLEEDVVELLRKDVGVSGQPVEVAALAMGIVELSGTVETQDDSDRAVALAQRSPGVRTVLNRLDVRQEAERIEGIRHRPSGPGTPRGDARWQGMGVGMGRRRQALETDPARRDDKADMVSEELGVSHAVEQSSEALPEMALDADSTPPAQENIAPGTELDLERSGLEGELNERRDDRG